MAKIKISDLAFELGCEGKELISFLQGKGIEAKRSNSSIEEADAEVARKHFKSASKETAPKQEEKPAKAEKAPAEEAQHKEVAETKAKPADKAPAADKAHTDKAASDKGADAPKKKKK